MIGIKKVQVVPLDENYGKIIDSFNTLDDKTSNAPSIRAVSEKIDEINATIDNEVDTLETSIGDVSDSKQSKVLSGTTEPTSSLGIDGDIYLQYS